MPLYDPYGREITSLPQRLETEERAGVRVRDQWSSYPTAGLTPQRLAGILKEADGGDIASQAELYEEMEEKDSELDSLLSTRRLAVAGLDWELTPASDSAEDKKIAAAVKENLDDLDMVDYLMAAGDAVGKGFSTQQILWDQQGKAIWCQGFEWVHQKRWTFREISADINAKVMPLPRLLTDEAPIEGIEVEPFKIVYHVYRARAGFTQRRGLLRALCFPYLFKNFDFKDWMIFIEKFGQPLRIGKFMAGASTEDKNVLRQAIRDLGTDAGVMISDQTILEIVESKTTGSISDVFQNFAEFIHKCYAKAILGQTATTEGTPGALGAEQARADVRRDLQRYDAGALARTTRQQLIWPMVGINFGWDKKLPLFRLPVEDPEDLEKLAQTHKTLVEIGMRVPVSYAQKKYGIPEPVGDEPVLAPSQRPAGGDRQDRGEDDIMFANAKKKAVRVPVGSRWIDWS